MTDAFPPPDPGKLPAASAPQADSKDRSERAHAAPSAASDCVWDSSTLFGDRREVLICHEGELYRLRKTRNGRLILQK